MDSRKLFEEIVTRVKACRNGEVDCCNCSDCMMNGYTEYDGEIIREDVCEMIKEWTRENEI